MTTFPPWAWIGFLALLGLLLVLDLAVLARGAKVITFRRAAVLSAFWIGVAAVFGLVLLFVAGSGRGGEYFAGYLVEKSLSVDNVFVFALIFTYFAVPDEYQYRVLFWGVVGPSSCAASSCSSGPSCSTATSGWSTSSGPS